MSCARANRDLAIRFLKHFREQASPSKHYKYAFWRDSDILVSEKWPEVIQRALDKCDLVLVLVSPAFLASQYIQDYELPKFIKEKTTPVISGMLQPVGFEPHDLKGLHIRHISPLDLEVDPSSPFRERIKVRVEASEYPY